MEIRKGYKMFRQKEEKLYPLYVLSNKETPIGIWIEAEEGPRLLNGKVKSKLNPLAFRPGWHIAEIPNAPWIGVKSESGELLRRKDNVWCEVEYLADICYTHEAYCNGYNNGKWAANRAYLKHIPVGGYYKYKTNSLGDDWIIAGEIKVTKILTNEEVNQICLLHNVIPQRLVC
jgi:hypothetical protein